jgi:ABC-type ATPase with predicted acetyltransferase domain
MDITQQKKTIKMDVFCLWKCKTCGKTQEPKENENWQRCCGEQMEYQPYRQFTLTNNL